MLAFLFALTLTFASHAHVSFAGHQQPTIDTKISERMIEIDGRKNPELIPDWLAWRSAFRTLALVDPAKSLFTQNLVLTASESHILFREARLEKSREATCVDRQEATRKQWANAKPEVLTMHLNDDRINCRWLTLDARDRVLDALGPEAQASLDVFLSEIKAGISSLVPKGELELYRRPQ